MELPSLDGFFESNRDRKMLEMDAVQESVVYRSDAWFGKGKYSEKEKSFSFFSTGKMKIEVEIPLEVLKFRENLKFLARKKLEI